MARDSQDREDLLRDATGLVWRVELKIPNIEVNIVCGFRADGSLSIYGGQEGDRHPKISLLALRACVASATSKLAHGACVGLKTRPSIHLS